MYCCILFYAKLSLYFWTIYIWSFKITGNISRPFSKNGSDDHNPDDCSKRHDVDSEKPDNGDPHTSGGCRDCDPDVSKGDDVAPQIIFNCHDVDPGNICNCHDDDPNSICK
jgi:hypothetical protein